MPRSRFLPHTDYAALKRATHRLLQLAGGPAFAAQNVTRCSKGRLCDAASEHPDCDERFLAIDQVADLEAHCGEPVVTRALAEMHFCDLACRPKPQRAASLYERLAALTRETSDVEVGLAGALASGVVGAVTPDEAVALRKEIREAYAQLASLDAELTAVIARAASIQEPAG